MMEENKKEVTKKSFLSGLLIGAFTTALLISIIYLGKGIIQYYVYSEEAQNEKGTVITLSEDSIVDKELITKMRKIEAVIQKYYYDEEFDMNSLNEGVYDGMVAALGDKYAAYYTEEELNDLMDSSEGIYYGVGAYVTIDSDTSLPMFTGIFEGSPAEEAGLRDGDIICKADDTELLGLSLNEAVACIKGPEGTIVHLTIYREGESDYLEFDVERRKVESPTVNYKMLDNNIGYLQITEFDEVTIDQFTDGLAVLKGSGMRGLIIDLRSNPGGNLSAVVDICRKILPQGMIVYTENKYGEREEYTGDGKHQLEVPLAVLINGNSASASEIMAGAIKDYGIGTLVGTTTFGKGIVQQVVSLQDGSAVKLTVSAYYTPKGNNIHGTGIEPDVEVQFDADLYYGEEAIDNQLEKAVEVLKEKM